MQNLSQICIEYFQTVFKYLFCLTHDADLSEELTQETFYQSIKTLKNFRVNAKYPYGSARLPGIYGLKNAKKEAGLKFFLLTLSNLKFRQKIILKTKLY